LPSPSNFSDDPDRNTYLQNRFAERTGIRPARTVIGSTVSASAQSVASNGSLTGGQSSSGRSALPSSSSSSSSAASGGSSTYAEVSLSPAYTSTWKTCKLLDGHCAFYEYTPEEYIAKQKAHAAARSAFENSKRSKKKSKGNDDDDDDDDKFLSEELAALKEYNASPSQASLIKYITDAPNESLLEYSRSMGVKESSMFSSKLGQGPLVAVCAGITLYESVKETSKTVKAQTAGMTVLWRNARTLALSLLIFSRGAQVKLEWSTKNKIKRMREKMTMKKKRNKNKSSTRVNSKNDDGNKPIIDTVLFFDEVMGVSIPFCSTSISLDDLREVNAIRADMSKMIDNPRAAADRAVRSKGSGGGGGGMSRQRGGGHDSTSPADMALGAAAVMQEASAMQYRVSRLLGFVSDKNNNYYNEDEEEEEEEDEEEEDEDRHRDYGYDDDEDNDDDDESTRMCVIRDFFSVADKELRARNFEEELSSSSSSSSSTSLLSTLLPPYRVAATDDTLTFGCPGLAPPPPPPSFRRSVPQNKSSSSTSAFNAFRDNDDKKKKPSSSSSLDSNSRGLGSAGAGGGGGAGVNPSSSSSSSSSSKGFISASAVEFVPKAREFVPPRRKIRLLAPPPPPPPPARLYNTVKTATAAKTKALAMVTKALDLLKNLRKSSVDNATSLLKAKDQLKAATDKTKEAVFLFESADDRDDKLPSLKLQLIHLWMRRKTANENVKLLSLCSEINKCEIGLADSEQQIAYTAIRQADLAERIAALLPTKKAKKMAYGSSVLEVPSPHLQALIDQFEAVTQEKVFSESAILTSRAKTDLSTLNNQYSTRMKRIVESAEKFKLFKRVLDEADSNKEKTETTLLRLDAAGFKTSELLSEAIMEFMEK